jgi:nitrous oxidase accessory protein
MAICFRLCLLVIAGLALAAAPATAEEFPSLQPLIDAAKAGDIITPKPGVYAGNLIIKKPITLDGQDKVTLDAGGEGFVISLRTDGATLRGLHLRNSGDQHNDLDAGIQVRGNYNVIKDNTIEDTLFGVELQQSHNNVVRRNVIGSKPFDLGVRGDGIRLWYSRDNRIEENQVTKSRDVVVWYSSENLIRKNVITSGRYGLHFMYALNNRVEDNSFKGNTVGAFLMYSDGITLKGNRISHGTGTAGMGIGMKESSDVTIEDNTIIYCAKGIYLDVSPFQPDTTNRIRRNRLAFNNIGILFHNDWTGNIIEDNRMENNFVQVSVNAGASAKRNNWDGNYWDDYRGFDLDKDGVGDSSHEMRVFADRLWMDVPPAAFFKGSAILSVIDFMERLAPFSEPIELLRDPRPKMSADVELADHVEQKTKTTEPEDGFKYDPFGLSKRVPKYMTKQDQN